MVVTVKHESGDGRISYNFRPIIVINQKTREVLDAIRERLQYGHLDIVKENTKYAGIYRYIINSSGNIIRFVDDVAMFSRIKKEQLYLLKELAIFQQQEGGRGRYDAKHIKKVLDIRDRVYLLNSITRSNIKQKYPREIILKEYSDGIVEEYKRKRRQRIVMAAKGRVKKTFVIQTVKCACGCGEELYDKDKRGRRRRYICGHNQNGKNWKWQKRA